MKIKLFCNRVLILAGCISVTVFMTSDVGAINTQIQTDSTLSGITALNVDAPGADQIYTLSEIHGKTAGNNLFYSFSNFNIGETDSAWFNLTTPDLENVISRVTGGFESVIEGTLEMTNTGSTPAFFLINSSGITFGSGASIDVPGAFYVSTASTLNLSDGSQYDTNETRNSTLSAAAPDSFGFLGDESGKLNIGSVDTDQTYLEFEPGTDVGFFANQIQIDNATVTNAESSQAGINLQIAATGEETTQIKMGRIVEDQTISGDLDIQDSSIDASGNGSGHLAIQSGNITANNSDLRVNNTGESSVAAEFGIDVSVRSQLDLDNGAFLSSDALSGGDAGLIIVETNTLNLKNGGSIGSSTFGKGNGGLVDVSASQILIEGKGGESQSTGIFSVVKEGSTGNGGSLKISASGSLRLLNASLIDSGTFSKGNAGSVEINAGQIEINGEKGELNGIFSNAEIGAGNAGPVTVTTQSLKLLNGGFIDSSTSDEGDAGTITIKAEFLELNGENSMGVKSKINSDSRLGSTGDAGLIIVETNTLNLKNGGSIDSSTSGEGDAGEVTINAKRVEISGDSAISSSAEKESNGQTGDIIINAENIRLSSDSRISIENEASVEGISLLTDTAINIDTTNLILTDSNITAKSSGNVDAGDIHISFKDQVFLNSSTMINPSTISTEANDGRGGDITIEGGDIIYLRDSAITTSVTGKSGDGGDINVAANSLIMSSAFIQANTAASDASGGKVTIKTPTLVPSGNFLQTGGDTPFEFEPFSGRNVIQAAAPDGVSGSINASTPQLNLSGMLTNLAIESFDSNALNRNMCTVDEGSSLFQSGKGGMRKRARDFLLSPML